MARLERLELINRLEKIRDSSVICYVTGDRENLSTRIAPDAIPVFYRHLEMIPEKKRIDLLLYTRGGDVISPLRLVHLIREYAKEFCVLVPFRAYSAGTLICLGADQIVMGKMGELGPIDPSVVNAFNPQDEFNPAVRTPVNIEDVYSFLALAGESARLESSDMSRIFSDLSSRIHPLALGNVHRHYLLIRSLAKKMLKLKNDVTSNESVQNIVDNLTEKLYAHNYTISRREAVEDIGLPVFFPEKDLESILWALYEDFALELQLAEPFDPKDILLSQRKKFDIPAGVIESRYGSNYFIFSGIVEKKSQVGEEMVNVDITKQGWRIID